MRKLFIYLAMLLAGELKGQEILTDIDSVHKRIELPAARIISVTSKLSDEQFISKIQPSFLKRNNVVQDLPYLLNNMAGVIVSSDAGNGIGYTDIKVRGTDLNRINVTMNGVPVNDPESQATYFVNTPDLASSSTEVSLQKGVGQSKNGNASFGASLSIQNLDVNNEQAYLNFQTDMGSFNTMKNMIKISSGLIKNKLVSTVRISNIRSDGYIDRSASNLQSLQWTTKYKLNSSTQVVYNYLKGKEKTGLAWDGVPQDSLPTNRRYNGLGLKPDDSYYSNQSDNYGQDYHQVFFDKQLPNNFHIGTTLFYTRGKGYYEEYKLDQNFSDYNLNNQIVGNDTIVSTNLVRQLWLDNHFYGGRVYGTYTSNKLDAGLYANVNRYQGKHFGEVIWSEYFIDKNYRWYNLSAVKSDANVYGMADYRFSNKLSLMLDAQIRMVNYNINGFRKNPTLVHHLDWLFFNPKIMLTYANEAHKVTLVSGIANKEPNRDDIETSTANLPKHEQLWNTEVKYIFSPNKNWALHATLYTMEYKNQLVLTGKLNDVGAYTRSNAANSYRRGLELEGLLRTNNRRLEAQVNVALSNNKLNSFQEYIFDYDVNEEKMVEYKNTDISFSPSVVASATFSLFPLRNMEQSLFNNLCIDLLSKYVGKQYLDNTGSDAKSLKPYFLQDVLIHCPFILKNKQVFSARLGVQNIFNRLYEARGYTYSYFSEANLSINNFYYPQAGIRYSFGIGIEI